MTDPLDREAITSLRRFANDATTNPSPFVDRLLVSALQKIFADYDALTSTLAATEAALGACLVKVNELEADRCVQFNGARLLARFVLSRLPKVHKTHGDGELFNTASAFLASDVPHTTQWLVSMMEVARVDKSDLPQQLYQAKQQLATLTAALQAAEGQLDAVAKWFGVDKRHYDQLGGMVADLLAGRVNEQPWSSTRPAVDDNG